MPKEKRHLDGGPLMPVSDPGEELHTPEYERRIAETLAERAERRQRIVRRVKSLRERAPGLSLADAKRLVEADAEEAFHRAVDLAVDAGRLSFRAERREDMVRAAAGAAYHAWLFGCAEPEGVVEFADRLLAELDRRRDAELQEAR